MWRMARPSRNAPGPPPRGPRPHHCPVLNVVAERDWIVPAPSAEVLKDLVPKSRDYRLLRLPKVSHVSMLAHPGYRSSWAPIAEFLKEA